MINILTIDVEDYYMVSAFGEVVHFEDWTNYESRIEGNTYRLLDLLDEYDARATFFVLGWVAEQYPRLVRNIHDRGHEVACHGYNHQLIYDLTEEQFLQDTRKAKAAIENAAGCAVIGYRATSYSIVPETLWALDILLQEGFRYDSSIFPIHHDRYGIPGAKRFSHELRRNGSAIMELPPSTLRVLNQNLPIAGGGYLRLYPIGFTEWGIRRLNERDKQPAVVYIHPWEIDPGQPRLNCSSLSRFRHYLNLDTTLFKMRRLLSAFDFTPASDLVLQYAEPANSDYVASQNTCNH